MVDLSDLFYIFIDVALYTWLKGSQV